MSFPQALLDCPHCNDTNEHRLYAQGDGTAIVWCSACHHPREMLLTQLHASEKSTALKLAAE
jgi:transcription elongation factor Elf1